MSRIFLSCISWVLCICCTSAVAQLLPDNKSLNAQSVSRWMQTNRDIAPIVQLVDSMNATDAELKAFEALSPTEQDQRVN